MMQRTSFCLVIFLLLFDYFLRIMSQKQDKWVKGQGCYYMTVVAAVRLDSYNPGQLFGFRFCLYADLKWGTKATDKAGQGDRAEDSCRAGRAAAYCAAHSRLCKYFFWAGAFLKQNSEPTAVNPTQELCAICQHTTTLLWLVRLEPTCSFLRLGKETAQQRWWVLDLSGYPHPKAEHELVRMGCCNSWARPVTPACSRIEMCSHWLFSHK